MNNSLYTDEVRNYIHTRQWPVNLVMQVEEMAEPAPHLTIVLYRDNFNAFDGEDQLQIANEMNDLMVKIRKDGIPIYMEVRKNVPGRG